MSSKSYIINASLFFAYMLRRIFCRCNNAHHSNSPSHRCSFSSTSSASTSARCWLVTTCVTTCVGLGSGSSVRHPSMLFMASKAALGLWRLNYSSRLHMSFIVICQPCHRRVLHTFYRFTTIQSNKAIFELTIIGLFKLCHSLFQLFIKILYHIFVFILECSLLGTPAVGH